jgi:cobalt transport protein ATP-binding subunit
MPITHSTNGVAPHLPAFDGPTLHVSDLHFSYPDGHSALKGVSFAIAQGEKVALVGPNGAGKSTLMLHLNGLLTGSKGSVTVAGLPVADPHLPLIRAKVGVVFQNPDDQLFSPTVFEDVAFGPLHMGLPEAEVRERVSWALAQVNMGEFAERTPFHMSMGQKKRVAIATVLAMKPDILVFDEPSAGLDPRARRNLIHLLQELPYTMLVSTHDMLLVEELFSRMIIMDEGRVVADGPTHDLLVDDNLLEQHGLERPRL